MIVFLNGKFLKEKEAKVSTFDHGFLYADGVYETMRTYTGKVWQIREHLKRLQQSAKMLMLSLPWPVDQMERWIIRAVTLNNFKESRIRVTVTRGVNGYNFIDSKVPTICIQVQELQHEPDWVYKKGVTVVTFTMERFLPAAKSLNLLPMVLARQKMAQGKAYEALLVDHNGFVREGTITNVYMIRGSVLWTPRKNILMGTTRAVILKIARKIGLRIRETDFTVQRLLGADEVFISNAPRGIIPVIKVNGKIIGKGKPGTLIWKLTEEFESFISRSILQGGVPQNKLLER